MVTLGALWLPILIATVGVFFMSFVMWMVSPHHRKDWSGLPDEDAMMKLLKEQGVGEGQYMFPHCADPSQMKDEAWMKKFTDGPSGMVIVRGPYNVGKSMMVSTIFNLIVSICVAYVATMSLNKASAGMDIFRLTATVGFLSYAAALGWGVIWFSRSWSSTLKEIFDGLVYGVLTGLVFMWMWPA